MKEEFKSVKIGDLPDSFIEDFNRASDELIKSFNTIAQKLNISDSRILLSAVQNAYLHILGVYLIEGQIDTEAHIDYYLEAEKINLLQLMQKYRDEKNPAF